MAFSVVTTMYNSENYLDEFYIRITETVKKISNDYELIFVNDGSPDNSLQKVIALSQKDKKVKIIDLSRNFGHHNAIMTGLNYATGDYVFLIDCDLEEAPELLKDFHDELNKDLNYDVIIGQQRKRKGGIIEKVTGYLFYCLFNLFAISSIPENQLIARLMTKRFVKALVSHRERELFFAGICHMTGFNQKTFNTTKEHKGYTEYSFKKKLAQTVNAIVSFSNKPLYLIFILGVSSSSISIAFIIYILILKSFFSVQIGYSSIIASIWAVGGILLISVGIIGIYLAKIFTEVKSRPIIIRQMYNMDSQDYEN